MKLQKTSTMCALTKRVVDDFNSMSGQAFMNKYKASKTTYYRRVMRYGDPYMNAPLAKFGKWLRKHGF